MKKTSGSRLLRRLTLPTAFALAALCSTAAYAGDVKVGATPLEVDESGKLTAKGKSAILRVVTYGDTTPNSIDVSPEAYALLDSGEYPRKMTWSFAECPATGNVMYEFQTGSSEWWTSLWVRNARLPLAKVEVKSKNHTAYVALTRGSDGTLTDGGGFGKGPFTLRLTSVDGKVLEETFDWPAAGIAGQFLTGKANL